MTNKGILYGIGVGPGDPELLTLKAVRALSEVDVIFAASSTKNDYSTAYAIAAPHLKDDVRVVNLGFPMTKDTAKLEKAWKANAEIVSTVLNNGENAAFLTLGDPLTYSTYGYLQRTLLAMDPSTRLQAIPGITSFHAAASKIGLVLAESKESLLITSGVTDPKKLEAQLDVADNAVILKAYKNFEEIRDTLTRLRLNDKTVLVSRLGMENESILMDIADAPKTPHYFSLALVKKSKMMKTAIVLAAFGSRHENARASLNHITERVRAAYPDLPVLVAYTSKTIRGHMKKAGEEVDSVPQALEKLLADGVTHVVIQSLHLIPGTEFHELLGLANEHMLKDGGFNRVEVGFPLVAGETGLEQVADIILSIAEEGKGENDAVLFMGHGTRHDGSIYYEALHRAFQEQDTTVHMGVMEHQEEAGIDVIIKRFQVDGVKKAYLVPFLFGAGWHVARDMIGDSDTSWKSRLEAAGIECEPLLKGAGEYDRLVDIWLRHLDDAMKRVNRC